MAFEGGSVRQAPITAKKKNSANTSKGFKVGAWIVAILCVVAVGVILGISVNVGWALTHPDKEELNDHPSQWGLPYQDIHIESRLDGAKLAGWQIETEEPAKGVVIMAHGYRKNRVQDDIPALSLTERLHLNGYHVILFDFRNSGESEGSLTTIGFHEKEDLISVAQYARSHFGELPVGVIGFSMGGATAILAAAEEPIIQAVIADSSFADMREYLAANLSHWSELPHFPFTSVILTTLPWLTGIDMDQVSPRRAAAEMTTPLFLIHGDGDEAIPHQNSVEIQENSASNDTVLWVPSGSGHIETYAVDPTEYEQRVLHFLNEHLIQE